MTAVSWLSLLASNLGFACGSYFLKRFADNGSLDDLGCSFAILALSNLIYIQVLAQGLGKGAALSSMTHLILMSVVGLVTFGERMSFHHMGGLMFAIFSIWLFANGTHAAS
ncbi:hypothetical protein [Epibacterium ulvae]|uniref:hypothetical protein n=1 Tax=Epibacterium ulvae TaxID=1156985 RepID=UPI0024910EA0|nr:hypothetical protein [Epibacterium ulvae]